MKRSSQTLPAPSSSRREIAGARWAITGEPLEYFTPERMLWGCSRPTSPPLKRDSARPRRITKQIPQGLTQQLPIAPIRVPVHGQTTGSNGDSPHSTSRARASFRALFHGSQTVGAANAPSRQRLTRPSSAQSVHERASRCRGRDSSESVSG